MLPQFSSDDKTITLIQNTWAKQLDPIISSPTSTPVILKSVALTVGKNTINHMLGANLQGWVVVRQRGTASIYDVQDTNLLPQSTLILIASSGVTVDLMVF